MRGLLYIASSTESVFFRQEIGYFHEVFDKVVVIFISGDSKHATEIAEEKGVLCYTILKNDLIKRVVNFFGFFCESSTKNEIKKILKEKNILKKLLYISFYGYHWVRVKEVYENILSSEFKKTDEIFLYSFWLTRNAYIISQIMKDRRFNYQRAVSRGHGYDLYEERNELNYLPFREFIFRHLDAIGLISQHGYNYFQNKYPDFKNKAKIFYLGVVNHKRLKKVVTEKEQIVIASCSSVIQVKRIDIIIDLISYISLVKGVNIFWIHIGDGELFNKIGNYAKEKLLKNNYIFLGKIDNSKVLDTLVSHDVDYLINMSDSEGLPVSMMEAFSLGIPVISRNVGGVSEIVGNGCGYLIKSINEVSFDEIIKYIVQRLNNIDAYKEESEKCIKRWNEQFNADINYRKFIDEILVGNE